MLVAEVMTSHPISLRETDTAQRAAEVMRDSDVGDVLVVDDSGTLCGIVTDRDLAVRLVAEGKKAGTVKLIDLCGDRPLVTVGAMDGAEHATELMRRRAVRRVPVVDADQHPVGIVSLGDLARRSDPESVLADISRADANG